MSLLAYGTVVRRLADRPLARRGRARLGAPGHVVADEVRALHPRGRRLGGAAAGAGARPGTWPTGTACRLPTWPRASCWSSRAWPAVIVGARLGERAHIDDNARLFALRARRRTTGASWKRRSRRCTPIPGDCGDEYRVPPFLTASGDLSHHLDAFPPPYEVRSVARRHPPLLQRHGVGAAGRLRAGGAPGTAHQRVGHDGHARHRGSSAAPTRRRRRMP